MKTNTVIRVFLASPMDVAEEREAFRRALGKVNEAVGRHLGVMFEVIGWEDYVVPGAGVDAQDVVNNQIRQEYDIFTVIFRDRIGTATHRALSGTMEEYNLALMKKAAHPDLRILCYFLDDPASCSEDIRTVKKKMSEDGVLYTEGLTLESFEENVFKHFSQILVQEAKKSLSRQSAVTEKKKSSSSAAIAIIADGKVVLVKRSASLKVGGGLWQIPGGKTEEKESVYTAAKREIREELGLELQEDKLTLLSKFRQKNLKTGGLIDIYLFVYYTDPSFLEGICLNRENETWELADPSDILYNQRAYLGFNRELMEVIWREMYLVNPLNAARKQLKRQGENGLSALSERDQTAYAFLSAMGLIRLGAQPVYTSRYSERILEEIISLSRNNIPLFEDTNVDTLRDLRLPKDEFPKLKMHREKMLFSHKSLMSTLSCKAPLKNSVRDVADVLFFGDRAGERYILLRWDFFANKYQMISGGIDVLACPTKEDKAAKIISRRFSDMMVHHFTYLEMTSITTHHFSAGSVDDDPILRQYNVDVMTAVLRRPDDTILSEFVRTINDAAALSIEYCWDLSDEQAKDLKYFRWCRLNDLLDHSTSYEGQKVQGFEEIIAAIGRQNILIFSGQYVTLQEEDMDSDFERLLELAADRISAVS